MGLFSDREWFNCYGQLTERVARLEEEVKKLRMETSIQAERTPPWDSYPCNSYANSPDFSVALNVVVRQILDHCGLKVKKEFQQLIPEHVKLEKRDEQTNSNS